MKKLLLITLAVALLLPALATAETFSLRNGYTWGMSVEDARALAAREGLTLVFDEEVGNTDHCLGYEDVPVGDYAAYFSLLFYTLPDGGLALGQMSYGFGEVAAGSPEAEALQDHLQTNLTAKYGMGAVPTLRGRYASLCWPLDDALVELMDSSTSPYSDPATVEYGVTYTALQYVEEAVDEAINTDGF